MTTKRVLSPDDVRAVCDIYGGARSARLHVESTGRRLRLRDRRYASGRMRRAQPARARARGRVRAQAVAAHVGSRSTRSSRTDFFGEVDARAGHYRRAR
jgi:hypothetical protein